MVIFKKLKKIIVKNFFSPSQKVLQIAEKMKKTDNFDNLAAPNQFAIRMHLLRTQLKSNKQKTY